MDYCAAPAMLMSKFRKIHQFQVFSVDTPIKHAIADYIEEEED
jgi:methionine aminotransferase